MRWLFIGIAVMALGMVLLGTLSSSAPTTANGKQVEALPDRYMKLRLKTPQSAAGKKSSGADEWAAKSGEAAPETLGRRAGGEEGAFGEDGQRPQGYRAKADKGIARGPQPVFDLKTRSAPAPMQDKVALVEEEAEEVDEDELADDAEPADMPNAPPPPPRIIAKPAPAIVTKRPASRTIVSADESKSRPRQEAANAHAYQFAPDKAEGALFGADMRGRKDAGKRKPRKRLRSALQGDDLIMDGLDAGLDVSQSAKGLKSRDVERSQRALPARLDLSLLGTATTQSTVEEVPPAKFLPRMCYFENTYLGGNAAWQEQLRRVRSALGHLRPLRHARLDAQAFDPPTDAGMALTASLDHAGLQQPGRVVLQVGLQGSQRFGWRRPPLDVVLVVDGPVTDLTQSAAKAVLARLSPRDRLGIVEAGSAQPLAAVADLRTTRDLLVDHTPRTPSGDPATLLRAMDQAGALLKQAASNAARIPGSQTVILLTRDRPGHAQAARAAAHRLQTQGAVVSVIDLGANVDAGWWAVANAGHGNFHRTTAESLGDAFDAELATLSKVVARLLRVNVRLGPHTEGIRVIGSRILGQQEVKAVKAREKATDRNLSKTMGVKANRGDDDDGIQTVIPYFYGGDSHVILVELWVDPGSASLDSAVAEITLKYKDMVNLDNATARAAVFLDRRPKPDAQAQRLVKQNIHGFAFAEALDRAAQQAGQGRWPAVKQTLRNHARSARDRQVVAAFEALIGERTPTQMQQALALASQQRKGTSNGVDP